MNALEHNIIPLPTRKELTEIRDSNFADYIERLMDPNGENVDIARLLLKIGKYDRQNLKICFENMTNLWPIDRISNYVMSKYCTPSEFGLAFIAVDTITGKITLTDL